MAVTTEAPFELEPSIPPLAALGMPGFDMTAWFGAWFPAKTPREIVDKMHQWLTQILSDPKAKEFFSTVAFAVPIPGTPESLSQYFQEEIVRWEKLFVEGGVERQ